MSDGSAFEGILRDYVPRTDSFDECVGPSGAIRSQWQTVLAKLDTIGLTDLRRRWTAAQGQIDRDGITFNPHDLEGNAARPWTLDAIPLVLPGAEWSALTARLAQRGRLMELILADLFGPQRLLKEQIIPPDVLYGHPSYYPRYHGLRKPNQRHLWYYATDLARSPNGSWWVTGDRTRAPFGIGYVLENRIVTSRMLASTFQEAKVHRLAPFYVKLREELRQSAPRSKDNPRIVLWTKGPHSHSYFEDSYLARYLGYTLAEGKDLAVRGDRVMLKTLGGLLPVEVLLRRLDDEQTDPVELWSEGVGGIPSLLEVMRSEQVAVANTPGSRLVESPLICAFLEGICRFFLGENLAIPSLATWWCGQPQALAYVLEHFDELSIRPAYRAADEGPVRPALMLKAERDALLAQIRAKPERFVGQEIVQRSTTPVLTDDGVEPWYVAIRAFLVAHGESFEAMDGGLARVSATANVLDFTMTAGERSQDLWILSEGVVDEVSLLAPSGQRMPPRRSGSELPSRVADDLFWLGRSVEQAEQIARLLRVVFESLGSESADSPARQSLLRALVDQEQIDAEAAEAISAGGWTASDIADKLAAVVFDTEHPSGLRRAIGNAVELTGKVRDRIAVDMWRTIDRLDRLTTQQGGWTGIRTIRMIELLGAVLAELMSFTGLAAESMTRTLGWRFLDLGRRVERTAQTTCLLKAFFLRAALEEPSVIETVLKVTDSLMTYRNRYLATFQVPAALDLLLTDDSNPRSIAYQLARMDEHVEELPRDKSLAILTPEQRLATAMRSDVRLADVFQLSVIGRDGCRGELAWLLERLETQIPELSNVLSSRYLTHAGLPRHFANYGDAAHHVPGHFTTRHLGQNSSHPRP